MDHVVTCVQFSPDGQKLLLGAVDEKITVLDVPSRRIEFKLRNTGERNYGIEFHPDTRTMAITSFWQAGSRISFRRLNDANRLLKRRNIDLAYDELQPAAFNESDDRLGFSHRVVELYLYPSLAKFPLAPHGAATSGPVVSSRDMWSNICFINGKRLLVAGSPRGMLVLWNADTGEIAAEVQAHRNQIVGIRVCSKGRRLVSSCIDGELKLWDVASLDS